MNRATYAMVALSAAVLATGCATSHPQNAEEFRQAVPGATFAKVESFEVVRPYHEVASTFRKKAPECLSVTVRTTSQSSTSYQVIVTQYKPTVVITDKRAEVHLQQHHKSGVLKVTKEPEGGYYLVVMDAYPLDRSRTKVQLFGPSIGHDVLINAMKSWATGQNVGCPDFTKS